MSKILHSYRRFNELLDTYKSQFPNEATNVLNGEQMTLFLPSDESLRDFTTSDITNVKQDRGVLKGVMTLLLSHIYM